MMNHTTLLNIEHRYTYWEYQKWMDQYWSWSFYVAVIYVILIFCGQRLMKSRPAFELRFTMFLWNTFLATFSIIAASRLVPCVGNYVLKNGFHDSVCNPSQLYEPNLCFWGWLFALSKVVELGDTIFIILRKQPLLFLHWYHHATVLCYSWYVGVNHNASARWFVTMNLVAHCFMYSYYAAKSLRISVPKKVSMCITTVQLVQMLFGVFITIYTYIIMTRGEPCLVNIKNIRASFLLYFSYFCLFLYFFWNVYWRTKSKTKPATLKMD